VVIHADLRVTHDALDIGDGELLERNVGGHFYCLNYVA
jgi:hypothetical protein